MNVDMVYQVIIVLLVVFLNYVVYRKLGELVNPLSIISFSFFLPVVFSLFRWSSLQSREWDYDTYVMIIEAMCAWLLFPALYLMVAKTGIIENKTSDIKIVETKVFRKVVYSFTLIMITAYLFGNYIQTGLVIPLYDPETTYNVHAEFPPIVRMFARTGPVIIGLLFVLYYFNRRKVDLFLLIVVFFIPLTRLSRIDPAMSAVVLLVMNMYFPVVKMKLKNLFIAGCITGLVMVAAAELGNQRTNRFGVYEIDYGQAIGWKPPLSGPSDIFPILYGYFPLSFENFDSFVRNNKENRTYGALSLEWLFVGVVKLNWLKDYQNLLEEIDGFHPVSSAATVPTSLYPFYGDFGVYGAWIFMFLVMWFWLELFRLSYASLIYKILFALYSSGFALASFQALILAPVLIQQMIELVLVFFIVRRVSYYEAKN